MYLGDAAPADQPPITTDQAAAWYDVLGQFKQKAADFDAAYADLVSQGSFVATQSADVQAEYQRLLDKASSTKSTIAYIQQATADVVNALAGAWQYVTGVWGSISSAVSSALQIPAGGTPDVNPATGLSPYAGLQGLGLLQLIPIAAVVAAIATVGYFLNDYLQFKGKLDYLKQAAAAGASSDQLSTIAKQLGLGGSQGITGTLGTVALFAGGLALVWFLPKIIGNYKALAR